MVRAYNLEGINKIILVLLLYFACNLNMSKKSSMKYKNIEKEIAEFLKEYMDRIKKTISSVSINHSTVFTSAVDTLTPVNCYVNIGGVDDSNYKNLTDEEIEYIQIGVNIKMPLSYYQSKKIISYSKHERDTFENFVEEDPDYNESNIEFLNGETGFVELDVTGYGEFVQNELFENTIIRVAYKPKETFLDRLHIAVKEQMDLLNLHFQEVCESVERILLQSKSIHSFTDKKNS